MFPFHLRDLLWLLLLRRLLGDLDLSRRLFFLPLRGECEADRLLPSLLELLEDPAFSLRRVPLARPRPPCPKLLEVEADSLSRLELLEVEAIRASPCLDPLDPPLHPTTSASSAYTSRRRGRWPIIIVITTAIVRVMTTFIVALIGGSNIVLWNHRPLVYHCLFISASWLTMPYGLS